MIDGVTNVICPLQPILERGVIDSSDRVSQQRSFLDVVDGLEPRQRNYSSTTYLSDYARAHFGDVINNIHNITVAGASVAAANGNIHQLLSSQGHNDRTRSDPESGNLPSQAQHTVEVFKTKTHFKAKKVYLVCAGIVAIILVLGLILGLVLGLRKRDTASTANESGPSCQECTEPITSGNYTRQGDYYNQRKVYCGLDVINFHFDISNSITYDLISSACVGIDQCSLHADVKGCDSFTFYFTDDTKQWRCDIGNNSMDALIYGNRPDVEASYLYFRNS